MPYPPTTLASDVSSIDTEECQSSQKEELEVLESIFPECISNWKSDGTLKLNIPIEFGERRCVNISKPNQSLYSSASSIQLIEPTAMETVYLTTLPPLLVHIILPTSYPLHRPPQIISVRASQQWLTRVSELQDLLLQRWQTGEPVLYDWVEYIRTGDFLQTMDLVSSDDDSAIDLLHPTPLLLSSSIAAYDTSSKSSQFSKNSHLCAVCLAWLKGSKCLELLCSHIFCYSCLEEFWGMCIEEGDIGRVGCPDPQCVKQGREAQEEEVERAVSKAEMQRWKWLREKRDLERDPTLCHCPIEMCQHPVKKPTDADPESGWDRFRQCSQCSFAFCSFCKFTWHGPVSPCPVSHTLGLVLEYLATESGSAQRTFLEVRYGRSRVRGLVERYEQEQSTKQWLSSSTTVCPGCDNNVEKSFGCNHMTCWKCRKHFCYRCGVALDPDHPYDHFSITGTPCYNKLYDWDEEDEEWQH
ncbi:RWD domain-containing protein [Crassisporium funariophilum]|nr:RWD domain-containing protein [Crassisporium funariophilum]